MKHNHFPDNPESSSNGPTPEQLRAGYVLGPDEKVALKIEADGFGKIDKFRFHGAEVVGSPLAKVTVSESSQAAVYVFERERDNQKVAILDPGDVGGLSIEMPLVEGQNWGIGRRYDRQAGLPKTVSGDHCSIGLDDQGNLVLDNHRPTNTTKIDVFTSAVEVAGQ